MPDTAAAQPADTPSGVAPQSNRIKPSHWRWLGPAFCTLIGVSMLWLTWNAWPDVLIDSGRESYVAWRLAEGDVLYRDVMVFNGPLSPYVNAMWMKLLGSSLRSLEIGNAFVIIAVAALIYGGTLYLAWHGTATIATAVFLTVFAFGNLSMMDSCSFMFPYSHEMTHGALLLLVLLLWIAMKWRRGESDARGRVVFDVLAGCTLGLVFLTKVELFVAGAAAVIVVLGMDLFAARGRVVRVVTSVFIIALCTAIPPLIAWALLARYMPAGDAMHGLLGSWNHIGNRELTGMLYFRLWMGLLSIKQNLSKTAIWSAIWGVGVGAIGLACRRWKRPALMTTAAIRWNLLVIGVFSVAFGWLVIRNANRIPWLDAAYPLSAMSLLLVAHVAHQWWRSRGGPGAPQWRFTLVSAVMSSALLLKLGFWPRVWHYGFVLAMPSVMLAVLVTTWWVPRWVGRGGGRANVCAAMIACIWIMFCWGHLQIIRSAVNDKPAIVESNGDTIRADKRGYAVGKFLDEFNNVAPRDATLAVLPEGAMLNYLTRRKNPTPYVFVLPSDLAMFGESRVLAAYEKSPPHFVVLAHRNTREYGYQFFGSDYGRPFMAWLQRDYEPAGLIGDQPLRSEKFGLLVLRRKASPPQR